MLVKHAHKIIHRFQKDLEGLYTHLTF